MNSALQSAISVLTIKNNSTTIPNMKMKKAIFTLTIFAAILLASNPMQAQAWQKNSKVLSLGFGASQFFHLDDYYHSNSDKFRGRGWYWPMTGQINFQGEFGVHKYVGLGFTTGIGGRGRLPHDYVGEVNIPIGMIVNFHFYQLIADHTEKNIHSDKLDIYAGLNFGSGVAATFYRETSRLSPIAFGGLHAGIRYYFAPKVGVNGELGFGKSIVNVGFVFKI